MNARDNKVNPLTGKKVVSRPTKLDKATMKQEVQILLNDLADHSAAMKKVVDSLQMTVRDNGDAAIVTIDDIRQAIGTFPSAKKSMDLAKKIVALRIKTRLDGE